MLLLYLQNDKGWESKVWTFLKTSFKLQIYKGSNETFEFAFIGPETEEWK